MWHHSVQHVIDGKLDFILWPESLTWLLFTGNSFSSNKKSLARAKKNPNQFYGYLSFPPISHWMEWCYPDDPNFCLVSCIFKKFFCRLIFWWPAGFCKVQQITVSVNKRKKTICFLPVTVFVILMLVGPSKCVKQIII